MQIRVSGAEKRKVGLVLGSSLLALSMAQPAAAQATCADGSAGPVCEIDVASGETHGPIVGVVGTATNVTNEGLISGSIAQAGSVVLSVNNRENGVIDGGISGTPQLLFAVTNAGTINGDVVLNDPPAANIFGAPLIYYISDGGELNGNLRLGTTGFTTSYFLQRGEDDGVSGTISAGQGVDVFAKSYSQTQSVQLGQYTKPSDFEIDGYEVRGAGTTLTLTGSGTTINLGGDGNVVNSGTITALNPVGAFPPNVNVTLAAVGYAQLQIAPIARDTSQGGNPFRTVGFGSALNSFENSGTVEGDIRLHTASFVNDGSVALLTKGNGTLIHAAANRAFTFENSGTIEMTEDGVRPLSTEQELEFDNGVETAVRIRSAVNSTGTAPVSITNSGEIIGGLDARMISSTFTFENTGTIEGLESATYFARGLTLESGELVNPIPTVEQIEFNTSVATILNAESGIIRHGFLADIATDNLRFENAGLISASNREGGIALAIEQELLTSEDDDDIPEIPAAKLNFVNGGTIAGGVVVDSEVAEMAITNSGSITRTARPINAGNYFDATYGGPAGVEVYNETDVNQQVTFTNTGSIVSYEHGASTLEIEIEAGEDDEVQFIANANLRVINSGTISAAGGATVVPGPMIGMPTGSAFVNPNFALVADASDVTGTSTVTIENQAGGVISALSNVRAVTVAGYQEQANTAGRWSSAIGASAEYINIINAGRIEGGTGTDFAGANIVFNGADLPDQYLAGAIQTVGDEYDADDTSTYVASIDHVTNLASGVIVGSIDLGGNDDIIENYGSISGDVFLRDGDDTFIHGLAAVFNGIADGGLGTDTLIFDITGALYTGTIDPLLRAKFINFEIEKVIGVGQVVSEEEITIGEGGELILTEDSIIDVGTGNTAVTGSETSGERAILQGTIVGNVDMRGGNNVVVNEASITGDILAGDGNNSVSNTAGLTLTGNILLGDGTNQVVNQGVITGGVTFGDGGNRLANAGQIDGDVVFGAGDDVLDLTGDWAIGGAVIGGAGNDVVNASFSNAGIPEADLPILDLSAFQQVEQFNVTSGTGKIGGSATFDEIGIGQGRLIGAAGSEINADVTVGQGGTFGSAGTVNGDITVGSGGTLSPGASPAVMIHNGDLTMAAGSNLVFEFVPEGQSDQMLISGSLDIASGATLTITGSRPLTPGIAYDMIIADEGITGRYQIGSWDRSAVQGFLRYTDTKLQLLGTFVATGDAAPQAAAAVDYVNDLLISGEAGTALYAAIPSLLDAGGYASSEAFGGLHAEAYASSTQLGLDQGLSLVKSLRTGAAAGLGSESGLYAFAEVIGDWRTLKGSAATGTASAKNRTQGLLGGFGLGNETASLGAFVGYLDSRQTISGLDARTDADGVIAGVSGRIQTGGLSIHSLIAHSWNDAATDRAVPGSARVNGAYRLRSLVADAAVAYDLQAGGGWVIRPGVGLTHISTKRGEVTETGSAAFAFAVDRETLKATFFDTSLTLAGGQHAAAKVEPWLRAGLRYQLNGDATSASGGFVGTTSRFVVDGADRKEVLPTLGAGIAFRLTPAMRVTASYDGEYGGGNGHQAALGLRLAF